MMSPAKLAPALIACLGLVSLAASLARGSAGRCAGEPRAGSDLEQATVERYAERLGDRISDGSLVAVDPPSPTRAVPRVSVFGDSTAVYLASGLPFHLEQEGRATPGIGVGEPGCGILRRGPFRWRNEELTRPAHCVDRERAWADAIARGRPDIAVVSVGPWEVCDRKLRPDDRWRHLGDPLLDAELRREMLGAVDLLAKDGALVIWLTSPDIQNGTPAHPHPEGDPARMARFNELVFDLERLRPGTLRVADLAAHSRSFPKGALDPDYRPDGVHLTNVSALWLAREWLATEILRLYRDNAASALRTRGPPEPVRRPEPGE